MYLEWLIPYTLFSITFDLLCKLLNIALGHKIGVVVVTPIGGTLHGLVLNGNHVEGEQFINISPLAFHTQAQPGIDDVVAMSYPQEEFSIVPVFAVDFVL